MLGNETEEFSQDMLKVIRRNFGMYPSNNYHDHFSLIADQHEIEVELLKDSPCVGLFDKNSTSNGILTLKAGQTIAVTVAAALFLKSEGYARPKIPAIFSSGGVLQSIHANFSREAACLVDFRSISPTFFEYGFSVAYLLEKSELDRQLGAILLERLRAISLILSNELEGHRHEQMQASSLIHSSNREFEDALRQSGIERSLKLSGAILNKQSSVEDQRQCLSRNLNLSGGQMSAQQNSIFLQGLTLSERRGRATLLNYNPGPAMEERRRSLSSR